MITATAVTATHWSHTANLLHASLCDHSHCRHRHTLVPHGQPATRPTCYTPHCVTTATAVTATHWSHTANCYTPHCVTTATAVTATHWSHTANLLHASLCDHSHCRHRHTLVPHGQPATRLTVCPQSLLSPPHTGPTRPTCYTPHCVTTATAVTATHWSHTANLLHASLCDHSHCRHRHTLVPHGQPATRLPHGQPATRLTVCPQSLLSPPHTGPTRPTCYTPHCMPTVTAVTTTHWSHTANLLHASLCDHSHCCHRHTPADDMPPCLPSPPPYTETAVRYVYLYLAPVLSTHRSYRYSARYVKCTGCDSRPDDRLCIYRLTI